MNTAAKVRREKDLHPERFCAVPRCLWKIQTARGFSPCKKHAPEVDTDTEPSDPWDTSEREEAAYGEHIDRLIDETNAGER